MSRQTKNDVQSYIDKASALHLVWESAWTACDNASAAVRQARRALRMAPADQDLKKKLQLAMEVKAKAEEHQQHVDEQLRMERAERLDLIALLACTKLTLRETVMFQYPLLKQHSHSGGSLRDSQSAAPQTYTQIVPWPELHEGGHELLKCLDNTQRMYHEPSCCVQPDDSCEGAPSQIEVRCNVMRVMDVVNEVLKQLGSAVKCSGGGDGRSMSYADLIIRLRSAQSSRTDMSGQVLGTVLVKSSADFTLMPGESLQDALEDSLRGGAIKAAVQEAYGMAVVDEAPVFVLTSYNVSVFFKRSNDVEDKRLWASEPVWINQIDPPACAMWAHALQQAEELRGWKPMLPRAKVPTNVEAQQSLPLLQQVDKQRQRFASDSLPSTEQKLALVSSAASDHNAIISRKRKRVEDQQSAEHRAPVCFERLCSSDANIHLQACTPLSKPHETNSHTSLVPQPATCLQTEETIPLSELGLTGELLEAFQYGYTLKGTWEGKAAAVKVYNLRKRGALAAYEREKDAYHKLKPLQGKAIPYLLRSGLQAHTAAPVIVTSYEGQALVEYEPVPLHLHQAMRENLQVLHAAGAVCRDMHCSNIVVDGNAVQLVNLECLALNATEEQKNNDMWSFDAMLRS